MIFFSKESAVELILPMPVKVTIYSKATMALYSYSLKVSMVTYDFYCLFRPNRG